MNIVGTVENEAAKDNMVYIAKVAMVGRRARELGRQGRRLTFDQETHVIEGDKDK